MEDFTISYRIKDNAMLINMCGVEIVDCELHTDTGIFKFSTLADAIQWIVDDEIGKLKAILFPPGEPPHLANLYRVTSRQNWELLDSHNG